MIEIDRKQSLDHSKMEEEEEEESIIQQLRLKSTEFLLRKDWNASIQASTQIISFSQEKSNPNRLSKPLCSAFSNRAEARFRLKEYEEALKDCDEALMIDSSHVKSLMCKGKILIDLNKYPLALDCFNSALNFDSKSRINNGNLKMLNGLIAKCKKLDYVSRTGNFDVSDWITNGFSGNCPELGEFVGCIEIKKSEISGRGLFSTKNLDVGTLILVTKSIATERCINNGGEELGETLQLVMWKNFVDKVTKSASKCGKTRHLINKLSIGENEGDLEVPNISLFKPETLVENFRNNEDVEMDKILSILDVNSLVEDSVSSKVLGKNSEYYGVGLWILPSLINHSCVPNARRLHIGDYVIVLASREVKPGEELTFAYYDVLCPLSKRKEMSKSWGFQCRCRRCVHEEQIQSKSEFNEVEFGGVEDDAGGAVFRLEECMRKCSVRGRDKGYLRASFWKTFSKVFESEKTWRRWGRKIPGLEPVVDSLVDVVGSDERVLKVLVRKMKRCGGGVSGGGGGGGFGEMERVVRLGRGVYGKVMKKQAMRILLELGVHE